MHKNLFSQWKGKVGFSLVLVFKLSISDRDTVRVHNN
jgi:hypothetical protein